VAARIIFHFLASRPFFPRSLKLFSSIHPVQSVAVIRVTTALAWVGFTPLPLFCMETTKAGQGSRSPLYLAYAQPEPRTWRRQQKSLPGPLFDLTVIGLFVVLGIAYML
jgi:hypothetical protein